MHIDELTEIVIGLCIKIHSKIGPACYEIVYEEILYYELNKLGIKVERQVIMPVTWEDIDLPKAFKLDLLIDDKLIVELKSVFPLPTVYFKQIKSHLSLMNLKHGFILNFKVNLMKEGIHRVYNNFGRRVY